MTLNDCISTLDYKASTAIGSCGSYYDMYDTVSSIKSECVSKEYLNR